MRRLLWMLAPVVYRLPWAVIAMTLQVMAATIAIRLETYPDGHLKVAQEQTAFVIDRDETWEAYVMRADGVEPTWSPDGSAIAFMSRRDGKAEVYMMNADGSDQINVSNDPANDFLPSWQPRGLRPPVPEPTGLRAYAHRARQALGL